MSFLKRLFVNLGFEYTLTIVRGWLNDSIGKFTSSELYEAIMEDKDLWEDMPDDMLETAARYKKAFKGIFDKYTGEITTELILKWMEEDHPDLHSTIINIDIGGRPIGIVWLDTQVNKIKDKIIEM